MIGNDVVDLKLARRQSNWQRKGFLNKVFSAAEQEIITTSQSPQQMVWLLWSMKEAAYKGHQRRFGLARKLNWKILKCHSVRRFSASASGLVNVSGFSYSTTSKITSDFIHTSVENDTNRGLKNDIFEAPSSQVKKLLIQKIAAHFNEDPQFLQLTKDRQGMPFLTGNDSFHFDNFSLSGHGRFYAYSLSLINCETSVKQS